MWQRLLDSTRKVEIESERMRIKIMLGFNCVCLPVLDSLDTAEAWVGAFGFTSSRLKSHGLILFLSKVI